MSSSAATAERAVLTEAAISAVSVLQAIDELRQEEHFIDMKVEVCEVLTLITHLQCRPHTGGYSGHIKWCSQRASQP